MRKIDTTTWTTYWWAQQQLQREEEINRQMRRDGLIMYAIALAACLFAGAFWPL